MCKASPIQKWSVLRLFKHQNLDTDFGLYYMVGKTRLSSILAMWMRALPDNLPSKAQRLFSPAENATEQSFPKLCRYGS